MPSNSLNLSVVTYRNMFLVGIMSLVVAACSTRGLGPLVLEGPDLHPSLTTVPLNGDKTRHVSRSVLRTNPQHSTETEFVRAIARSGSQGNLGDEGIRSALYALYLGQSEVGFYGLEAASADDADRLEAALGKIWAHNTSIHRAQVHRRGLTLVVVWTDGVPSDVWEAVNARVAERLMLPSARQP
jgi:hypothetical protein